MAKAYDHVKLQLWKKTRFITTLFLDKISKVMFSFKNDIEMCLTINLILPSLIKISNGISFWIYPAGVTFILCPWNRLSVLIYLYQQLDFQSRQHLNSFRLMNYKVMENHLVYSQGVKETSRTRIIKGTEIKLLEYTIT